MSCSGLTIRHAAPTDWARIMAVMVEWWGGRDLAGFLVGFVCLDHPGEAYVHFAGVHPAWRRAGLGADLYGRFFALAESHGCTVVRAVTAPVNRGSVAFHRRLGFRLLPGDDEVDGLPVTVDPGPYGEHLVHFERRLEAEGGGA